MYYRGLQILSKDFNLAFGRTLIPCGKLAAIVVFIFAFFAMVRLREELGFLSVVMVSGASLSALLLLIPMSLILSNLYEASFRFQEYWSEKTGLVRDRHVRKHIHSQLRACLVIRCEVGGLYYMEARAKLTLLHQVVNGVVFLLVNV